MANNCYYTMRAVSKDKNALDRLVKIMEYKDNEYYIYRCFSAEVYDRAEVEDFFVLLIDGDVAWSCDQWFNAEDEEVPNKDGNGAHLIRLDALCKKLKIGMEVWSQEPGIGFEEHYIVNADGKIIVNDCADWCRIWEDEDGEELDQPEEEGGFYNYGSYADPKVIYGRSRKL